MDGNLVVANPVVTNLLNTRSYTHGMRFLLEIIFDIYNLSDFLTSELPDVDLVLASLRPKRFCNRRDSKFMIPEVREFRI